MGRRKRQHSKQLAKSNQHKHQHGQQLHVQTMPKNKGRKPVRVSIDSQCWIAQQRPSDSSYCEKADFHLHITRVDLTDFFTVKYENKVIDTTLIDAVTAANRVATQSVLNKFLDDDANVCNARVHSSSSSDSVNNAASDVNNAKQQQQHDSVITIHKHSSCYSNPDYSKFYSNNDPLPNGDCGDGIINPYSQTEVENKYWAQRHRFFARFDEGILMDAEGWYSVTPEIIAQHITETLIAAYAAKSSGQLVVLDAFCGVGGNVISFAQRAEVALVIAVDTNQSRLRMAAHNCRIYDIPKNKVVFIHADAFDVFAAFKNGVLDKSKLLSKTMENEHNQKDKVQAHNTNEVNTADASNMNFSKDSAVDSPFNRKVDGCFVESCNKIAGNSLSDIEKNNDMVSDTSKRSKLLDFEGYTIGGLEELPDTINVVFLSPPWGKECYNFNRATGYNLNSIQLENGKNGEDILKETIAALPRGTGLLSYFLPRNMDGDQFAKCLSKCLIHRCVLEQNRVNKKLKTVTAYCRVD